MIVGLSLVVSLIYIGLAVTHAIKAYCTESKILFKSIFIWVIVR